MIGRPSLYLFTGVLSCATWISAVPMRAQDRPAATPIADVTKSTRVEVPAAKILKDLSAGAAMSDNPKVEPGLVRWRASFAEASAAAKKSGRPVLLFQLLGRLDEQFC